MIFSDHKVEIGINQLHIGDKAVEQVGSNCKDKYFRFVGHVLDDRMTWEGHIEHVAKNLLLPILELIQLRTFFLSK